MFRTKISKDEVNLMPVVIFEGKITIVDELSKIQPAIDELLKYKIVGIDTETKPSFTRGTHHKVSLVQISTLNHCFLFRLNKFEFPVALAEFLADENIKKIGLSLRDDLAGLNKQHPFKPANCIDIQTIAQNYGILELGLQKIYAILFEKKNIQLATIDKLGKSGTHRTTAALCCHRCLGQFTNLRSIDERK